MHLLRGALHLSPGDTILIGLSTPASNPEQIDLAICTNIFSNLHKYIEQFAQLYLSNTFHRQVPEFLLCLKRDFLRVVAEIPDKMSFGRPFFRHCHHHTKEQIHVSQTTNQKINILQKTSFSTW